ACRGLRPPDPLPHRRSPRHRKVRASGSRFQRLDLLVRHHLLAGGRGLTAAEGMWGHLQSLLAPYASELAALVLAEPIWNDPPLPELPTEALAFLLRTIWRCLELAGRLPVWDQKEVHMLLTAFGSRDAATGSAQAALAAIPSEIEPL